MENTSISDVGLPVTGNDICDDVEMVAGYLLRGIEILTLVVKFASVIKTTLEGFCNDNRNVESGEHNK